MCWAKALRLVLRTDNIYKAEMQVMESEQSVGRKQSASDLHSRLKTRKLLGVGELVGDSGDIYRSKVNPLAYSNSIILHVRDI